MDTKTIDRANRAELTAELDRLDLAWSENQPNKDLRAILHAYNQDPNSVSYKKHAPETGEVIQEESKEQPQETQEPAPESIQKPAPVNNPKVSGIIAARKREATTGIRNQPSSLKEAMAQRRASAGQVATGASVAEIIQQRRRK